MLRKIPAALALAALGATMLAAGPASAACGNSTGRSNLPANSAKADEVGVGNMVDKYTVVVPPGARGYIALQMVNGDIDIEVCNASGTTVCEGTNIAGVHDGCHFHEASVPLPPPIWNPEEDFIIEWGNALSPGTYRLDVRNCFHSSQGTGCDYADTVAGVPVAPGAHDAAPPVQYVVAFVTN